MKPIVLTTLAVLIATGSAIAQPQAPQRKDSYKLADVGTHDPVMAKEGNTYYLFATGMGISVMSSNDNMKTWKFEKSVFESAPAWTTEMLPNFRGHMWAPDVLFYEGEWHIFYSCSAFGRNTSMIGHATNKTLDPKSPDFKWVDKGCVIQSVPNRDMWNAIDPNVIVDEEGNPWMDFGSFWDGIKLFKMKKDMSGPAVPQEWYSVCRRERKFEQPDSSAGDGAVEAPFIMKHGNYYYLFTSFDYCCRGARSNYNVVVGRSEKVSGPYLDKDGKDMAFGGGSVVLAGNKDWAGVGHNAAYDFDGKSYFIAHGYDLSDNGASKLVVREIKWSSDGWPIVEW